MAAGDTHDTTRRTVHAMTDRDGTPFDAVTEDALRAAFDEQSCVADDDLGDRAGLPDELAGEKPVPQMARRFWYDAYSATQEAIFEEVGEIAAEQGSASAEVVLQEYLSPERRRRLRRDSMRDRLAEAFGGASA